jgi:hypothetical protein
MPPPTKGSFFVSACASRERRLESKNECLVWWLLKAHLVRLDGQLAAERGAEIFMPHAPDGLNNVCCAESRKTPVFNGSPPLARIPNARIHLEELSRMEDGRKTLPERNCQNKIVVIGFRPNCFRKMHEIIDTQITSKVELYFAKWHAFLDLFPIHSL